MLYKVNAKKYIQGVISGRHQTRVTLRWEILEIPLTFLK